MAHPIVLLVLRLLRLALVATMLASLLAALPATACTRCLHVFADGTVVVGRSMDWVEACTRLLGDSR